MPRPEPHPLALFSLLPLNERAEAVLAHQSNGHLVSRLEDGKLALDIGHVRPMSGGNATLATLGRNGDVFVEGSSIAKIQCSFEIDLNTKVVMFYDRSHGQTSQVFGKNASPFEYGRPRRVVVQEDTNTIIGMGGVGRDLIQFELIWHCFPSETAERVKSREGAVLEENLRLARTLDETATVSPSRMETRIHTLGPQQPENRYAKIGDTLGYGQYGKVYKVVNLDTGELMAVKILERPTVAAHQRQWMKSKREVEILSRINHDHIVDYISSQGWDGPRAEIFMGLKEGTLESLLNTRCSVPITDLAQTVLHHMLQAIDCLATHGIIHRDVKPENILYISRQDQYHFQLGDFGLSNHQLIAATCSGTPLYMAPEMYQNGEQTHKADVWSLFVTMLWTLNIREFREISNSFNTFQDARKAILSAASSVDAIREMVRVDPEERASAAQMLVKCYDGQGLTTPRHRVPPIDSTKDDRRIPTTNADRKAPAATGPVSTDTTPQAKDFQGNTTPATGQLHTKRARFPQAYLRPPGGPPSEKFAEQALDSRTPASRRVLGGSPDKTTGMAEQRKRPRFT
ncbi:Serine/threonine-protein kinase 33 [Pleurostoma richardsiae]|uniref:non-specific serine/threonine protein kinase n=1 Tax=Pleurostoma richardsiae TaxID=41990 RepID=A0AA38S9S0_9PEZI|nr:Serine/threonine-protein kinase 33 [Pleurostoma richardsiae]